MPTKYNQNNMNILLYIVCLVTVIIFPFFTGILFLFFAFFSQGRKSYFFLIAFCLLFNLIFLDCALGNGADLERYMQVTRQMSMVNGLMEFFQFCRQAPIVSFEKSSYLFLLIQYIVSRTNYFNFLSYISAFLGSFFIFFPFLDSTKNDFFKRREALILSLLSFFFVGYGVLASTMRWGLAVTSLFFFSYIYFEKAKNTKKFIWLLFIPLLFHIGIIADVLFVIYASLVKKINIIQIIIPIVVIIIYFANIKSFNIDSASFLGQINMMSNVYSNNFMANYANQNSQIEELIQFSACFMIIIYNFLTRSLKINSNIKVLSIILVFGTFAMFPQQLILQRYLLFLFLILAFNPVYKNNLFHLRSTMNILVIILLFALTGFNEFVNIYRFNFTLPGFNVMFENVISILENMPSL